MNSGTWIIVNLLGGIALLLWGVRMVRTGILRAWGEQLKTFIESNLNTRLAAFGAGVAATVFLQSSTATALIVTGLAASGVIGGATGLAVLLGADLGSALITAVFAASGALIASLSPILIFAGFVTFSVASQFRARNAGRIMMGLGLMLLALRLIVAASGPLHDSPLFHRLLTVLGQEPILALLAGVAITWLSHSSLASILLITAFAASGALDPYGALAFVLGVNLGAGLPAFTATAAQPPAARRLPLANLVCRGAMALAFVPLTGPIAQAADQFAVPLALQPTGFHAGFNLLFGMIALPLIGTALALTERMMPEQPDDADELHDPRYLDNAALETPALALSNAQADTVRMTELLHRMFRMTVQALETGGLSELKTVKALDERLNAYHNSIHTYLAALLEAELNDKDDQRARDIMMFISNLEHAGDIIHLSLSIRVRAKWRQSITFNPEQNSALDYLIAEVETSLKMAANVLTSEDVGGARRLLEQKQAFRTHESTVMDTHFRNTGHSSPEAVRAGALYMDLIRDFHQINSHIVSAGYPVLEAAGLLRDTRVRKNAKRADPDNENTG